MSEMNFSLCKPKSSQDWNVYHQIRKESIFDPINVTYDLNHPSLTNRNNHHFCFFHENQIIGTLQIEKLNDNKVCIRTIVIEKNQRNRGFGSILLKLAETKSLELGASIIHLHGSPEAKSFYLRNGYKEMLFPDDISINSETIDFGKYLNNKDWR